MSQHDESATADRPRQPGVLVGLLAGLAMMLLLVAGVWILGILANNDTTAMLLTSIFFGLVLVGGFLVVRRNRRWFFPLAVPFALVSIVVTVVLGRPLLFDQVVDETVVSATEPASTLVASGTFEPLSHPGVGTASVVSTPEGDVLTLTDFETDNGPDIRVYLSRETDEGGRGESFVDLGALKGNKGNQQYAIPEGLDLAEFDAVVLWCRAFAVGFTQAPLAPSGSA